MNISPFYWTSYEYNRYYKGYLIEILRIEINMNWKIIKHRYFYIFIDIHS